MTMLSSPVATLAWDPSLDTSRAWIEIDTTALDHNIRILRGVLQPKTQLWAVVKANAYGHGLGLVATAALEAGVDGICVATLSEGVECRQKGVRGDILILGALNSALELEAALRWNLEIPITQADRIPLLVEVAHQHRAVFKVHLNVDTGMARLGVPWTQAAELWQTLLQLPELDCRSLYSHLATADESDPTVMQIQQQRFAQVIEAIQALGLPLPSLHLDNSAGMLASAATHYHRIRAGIVLYGVPPAEHLNLNGQLRPILQLKARITQLRTVAAGTGVSYGYRYQTTQQTLIATVSIGYADGVPRRLSGWLRGRIRGEIVAQIGTITMDQCMWDVTRLPEVEVGDVVELIGEGLPVQAWADQLGTIPYEILCGFSARLPRIRG